MVYWQFVFQLAFYFKYVVRHKHTNGILAWGENVTGGCVTSFFFFIINKLCVQLNKLTKRCAEMQEPVWKISGFSELPKHVGFSQKFLNII